MGSLNIKNDQQDNLVFAHQVNVQEIFRTFPLDLLDREGLELESPSEYFVHDIELDILLYMTYLSKKWRQCPLLEIKNSILAMK